MAAATPLEDLSEKSWELQIIGTAAHPGVARQVGFKVYHTLRSKGSQPGYPDWTLVRERLIFLELKSMSGRLSEAQASWILALLTAYQEVYVARPADLDALGKVLAHRGVAMVPGSDVSRAYFDLTTSTRSEAEKVLG